MKKLYFLSMLLLCALCLQAQQISRVEPLSWWTDMKQPLTLLFYGENLKDASVSVERKEGKSWKQTEGLKLKGQHNAESPNYLFVDVDVRQAGEYRFTLQKGKKKARWQYSISERRAGSKDRKSFTSADMFYLIMSDRFVDGDESNNISPLTSEGCDKNNMDARFGGDIQGIIQSLDNIAELGATVIWPTPLLLDNEPAWSYHGYACADYYHIDPRMGSNELYKEFVQKAHEKGLKVVMDIVTNHCGKAHWWMKDLPYSDWIHQHPEYTQTINAFTTYYDPNASDFDRKHHEGGWFDRAMPDMNLDNPDLLQYFKQWAIWWVEYANLDGFRVDTYPYNEPVPMSEWCKAVKEEYPNFNIVGETWTRPASNICYWQAGAGNKDGFDSHLPAVMDFPTSEAIRSALSDDGKYWHGGLTKVYEALTQDYLYSDVNNLLIFLDNHDMDRIADVVKDNSTERQQLAAVMLATLRGIPQLLYGAEIGMRSMDITRGHSGLRRPMPLRQNWNNEEKQMFDYQSRMFQFRKNEPILHTGKTMHFFSDNNTYAYFRYNDEGAVFVFLNGSNENRQVPVEQYKEISGKYKTTGVDIISGKTIDLGQSFEVAPLTAIVVKLTK